MNLLESTIDRIEPRDDRAQARAKDRLNRLTMPHWALGRLMDLAEDLAGITGSDRPSVARRTVVVMAADHGVTREGVSKYPQEVTAQMVNNFIRGGAGINALARTSRAKVLVVDIGVAGHLGNVTVNGQFFNRRVRPGTDNIAQGPAMSRQEAVQCVETGIEIVDHLSGEVDLFGTGDMGIGNTTPSAAIASVMTGRNVEEITGRGTGIDDEQWRRKIEVIKKCISVNQPDVNDPLDILSKLGGLEIGGIAGLILGAAAHRKPVIVDGFISTAGALIAARLCPRAADYMIASHRSAEKGHGLMLEFLGKKALLDLDLRLGEGTGSALAMNLVDAAVRILTEVATFEEAAVSQAKA